MGHGCQAERHEEARAEVYRDRILRGQEFYSTNKVGAIGADLGAVACFFEAPWSRISSSLTEAAQAWLLNEAASRLRALGRLTEALEPMQATLGIIEAKGEWENAAIVASNLSELELTLDAVHGAVRDAEQSVVFADRSGDAGLRMIFRTTLADALHQEGRRADALARFLEAEEMQVEGQPSYPLLYSLWGFRYCDLLLAEAELAAWQAGSVAVSTDDGGKSRQDAGAPSALEQSCCDVEQRATQTLQWAEAAGRDILSAALDHFTLGRAGLYRTILERPDASSSATLDPKSVIEQAVDGLRRAGTIHHVPRGLLTRAWLRRLTDDSDGARADLDEAREIAERGPMPLFLADVDLYTARLFHDRDALSAARRRIEEHGYGRRLEELADAEEASVDWPSPSVLTTP